MKNEIKNAPEKREWKKPSIQHHMPIERVKAGMYTTAMMPENATYAPS